MPEIDLTGGVSKVTGLIVAILSIVSVIVGAVFWIVHQNDMLQTQVVMLQQQVQMNSEGIKEINSRGRENIDNMDKVIRIVAMMHDKEKQR